MSSGLTENLVLWEIDGRGVATVTLNRPDKNNAYNDALLLGLHAAMDALAEAENVRVVVIRGAGRHFQAGADLDWLKSVQAGSVDDNLHASQTTGLAVDRLNQLPVPVVTLVQGFCVGGGTGLLAASDVVVAAADATFAISEVRWGLTASVIIPQLNDAIGVRQVRRYALTGERFDAIEAQRIGLVHEVVPADELESRTERVVGALLENAPMAIAETKRLAFEYSEGNLIEADLEMLIEHHSVRRQSEEAREGLTSFTEKRAASWSPKFS